MGQQDRLRQLEEEIERRIEVLEADGQTGKRFSKRDYVLVTLVVLLCLAAVIWGAWL
ncbi:hypothetical protein [Flavonifractor hominis]|uniref:Uncharacterized protein n=1 Tax=Flavonifractor hominis TaxID=3133178 RepID=A0ABV1EQJ5_9FIRM